MAVESIGAIYETKIPGLTDAADIQAAFYAYHYGAYTSVATTAGIITPSMAKILLDIETDIAALEARPSSGGDATSSAPVAGDFTPSGIPDGYIWVDFDGAMTSSVIGATAVYNNNAPTSGLTAGLIWVDKDATTSTTGNPFIPQSIIAAKGDLLAGSANDTVVVLTVGTNGQYLKADSSTASGLTWGDPGDLTAVSAGTGITVTSGTGPIPSIAIDTATTVDLTTAQTLTNKTLTTPTLNNPSVTSGTFIAGTFTSSPTLNAPIIYLSLNSQAATSYTSVLTDASKLVTMDLATANSFLIPTNASVAFPIGTTVNVIQIGAGQTKIVAATTSTTTVNSTGAASGAPLLRARYSAASCIKVATDTWYVVGDLS